MEGRVQLAAGSNLWGVNGHGEGWPDWELPPLNCSIRHDH